MKRRVESSRQGGMRELVGIGWLALGAGLVACDEAPDTSMFPEGDTATQDLGGGEDTNLPDAPTDALVEADGDVLAQDVEDAGDGVADAADTVADDAVEDAADTTVECPAPCQNEGACETGVCVCTPEWTGETCETPVCDTVCDSHGRCVAPDVCECDDGWFGRNCTVKGQGEIGVPPATFVAGSPLTEYGRLREREGRREVSVTRAFLIHDTEMTRAEWGALSEGVVGRRTMPTGMAGTGDDLPVTNLTWWSAVAVANALSERDGFTPCYVLEIEDLQRCGEFRSLADVWVAAFAGVLDCPVDLVLQFQSSAGRVSDQLDCDGWRLPLEIEWELAARSVPDGWLGTALYDTSGQGADPSAAPSGGCDSTLGRLLDPVAWWCGDASDVPGPVRAKAPTALGLHGMLGNVAEWVWDGYSDTPPSGADVRIDAATERCSFGGLSDLGCRVRRGGSFAHRTDSGFIPWRFAFRAPSGAARAGNALGVRWVRSGKP